MEENPLFVKVSSPVLLRKELISSNISILENLKRQEDIIDLQKDKRTLKEELINQVKGIEQSINHLKNRELPSLNIEGIKQKETHKESRTYIREEKEQKTAKETYSKSLEDELTDLKAKLAAL